MVGLIQKILLDMVREVAGEEVLIRIKQEAGISPDKEFQINNVYDDAEWQRLLSAAIKVLNLTPEQADEIYANYFLKDALRRFPTWFNMSKNSYEFLLIQPTIHNCFASSALEKKDRDAINDKFIVDKFADNPKKLITHYRSKNHHCGLYKALAKCVINHYQDEAEIVETQCLKQGDKECQIHIEWLRLGA